MERESEHGFPRGIIHAAKMFLKVKPTLEQGCHGTFHGDELLANIR